MKRGRTWLVTMLIVSLLVTAVAQRVALQQRRAILKTSTGESAGTSLAGMDSYALALLLGGLRGPLVMFFWMNSETQKQQKDLAGVETQIEWIRLLQPEFDTVHLFQIWNKAYNISVQMASQANQYSVVLDALDYARNVEKQRPDNLNMLMAVGSTIQDKFAGSNATPRVYFRNRVREDTKYRQAEKFSRTAGVRPTRYPSLLDEKGYIRPEFLAGRFSPKGSAEAEFYDGSELQFLKQYEPFPEGVASLGLAFNYYKRVQVLQRETGQQLLQTGDMIVDSRPGLALKAWSEDEWDLGVRAELRALGLPEVANRQEAILASAEQLPSSLDAAQVKKGEAELRRALYFFNFAIRLTDDAEAAYKAHLANPDYQMHLDPYRSHVEQLRAARPLITAERCLIQAALEPMRRAELLAQAQENYRQAKRGMQIMRLRYFVEDAAMAAMFPAVGLGRWNLEQATDAQLDGLMNEADRRAAASQWDPFEEDAKEYRGFVKHCTDRLKLLGR